MKIFLSAVSGQFKSCREALASDLRAVGPQVFTQEEFPAARALVVGEARGVRTPLNEEHPSRSHPISISTPFSWGVERCRPAPEGLYRIGPACLEAPYRPIPANTSAGKETTPPKKQLNAYRDSKG